MDVTAGRLLVLPGDLQMYRDPRTGRPIEPADFPIARAARMSISIPYFFDPVELVDTQGRTCLIVDGGTLSNFPVWLWDVDPKVTGRRPVRPELLLQNGRAAAKLFLDSFSLDKYENTYHAGLPQNPPAAVAS